MFKHFEDRLSSKFYVKFNFPLTENTVRAQ